MKYCSKCGKEIMDEAVVCVNCGCAVENAATKAVSTQDTGSAGWAVLGFFIPLAGLILYLIWKNTRPMDAKKAGMGALVSWILGILFSVIYGVAVGAMVGGMYY